MRNVIFDRKIIFGLIVVVFLMFSLAVASALVKQRQDVRGLATGKKVAKFSIKPSSGTYKRGSSYSVNILISVNKITPVKAAMAYLEFNPSVFEISNLNCGSNFPRLVENFVKDNNIRLACFVNPGGNSFNFPSNYTVPLGTFTATVKSDALLGSSAISYIMTSVVDSSTLAPLSSQTSSASFNIAESSAVTSTPPPVLPPTTATSLFINAGGPSYTDLAGYTWLEDQGFTGGSTYSTTQTISGTNNPLLYQTERYGMSGYQFNVDNGLHYVTLKFAEIYTGCQSVGCRLFNVSLENTQVLTKFDIYQQAGGGYKALDMTFPVNVTDGVLNIDFTAVKNNPKISGLVIN